MHLTLETITFNHDPMSSRRSALNIRKNKDMEVLVPEYDHKDPRPTTDSCAAYAIRDTLEHKVFVKVEFTTTRPGNEFKVQATDGGILGPIDPFIVSFGPNETLRTVNVLLTHSNFTVVSRHDVTWNWECRHSGQQGWQPLASTSHRIYLTLTSPHEPWEQHWGSPRLPWTDLLDHACDLTGPLPIDDPKRVTRALVWAIYQDFGLRYDIVYSGSGRYDFGKTGSEFWLSGWIDYVLNDNPPSQTFCDPEDVEWPAYKVVACYDTAAALALMAGVLGVATDYYWHEPFGYVNKIELIGRPPCNNPSYYPDCVLMPTIFDPGDYSEPRKPFEDHTYVKLAGGNNYDACMRQHVEPFDPVPYLINPLPLARFWYLILSFVCRFTNPDKSLSYRDRAFGFVVDTPQMAYQSRFIEFGYRGEGQPIKQDLDFSVM
jgi:hypothetical protein